MAALPTDDSIQYQLQHEDSAVNIVYTNLDPLSTYEYLEYRNDPDDATRNIATTGYGPALTQAANTATTEHVTDGGISLPQPIIEHLRNNAGQGVLLMEARAPTDKPLKLIIKRHGTTIAEASLPLKITPVRLKTVSFSGPQNITVWADDIGVDNDTDAKSKRDKYFDAPHVRRLYTITTDKQRCFPTAYVRNSKMSIAAAFEVPGSSGSMRIRATGPNGMTILATPTVVVGNTVSLPTTEMSTALPNTVKYYNRKQAEKSFYLKWEMEIAGQWTTVGTTRHTIYVTLDYPTLMQDIDFSSGATSLYRNVEFRQETLFELGCRNADGEAIADNVSAKTWDEFTDCKVWRIDGKRLSYYKNYDPIGPVDIPGVGTSVIRSYQLLAAPEADGQCGSWADLFIRVRQIQGIASPNIYCTFVSTNNDGFAVNEWNFTGAGTSGNTTYPYLNISPLSSTNPVVIDKLKENIDATYKTNYYDWAYSEVTRGVGIAGQNNSDPASLFGNHQVVKITGTYYDPSYGKTFTSLVNIEDKAIAGYFKASYVDLNEAPYGLDLSGRGTRTEINVRTAVFLFKRNPRSGALKETLTNR
jgi:hypothetical protein